MTVNQYTIVGTPQGSGTTSPDLCRVYGYIRNLSGQPMKGLEVVVRSAFTPLAVVGSGVFLQEKASAKTDSIGLLSINLLRGATVRFELQGLGMDLTREVEIPDQDSVDLVDLLFPYVVSLSFVDTSPYAATLNENFTVDVEALLSNGQTVDVRSTHLTFSSTDEAVLVHRSSNSFYGVVIGTAAVNVADLDQDAMKLNAWDDGTELILLDRPDPVYPGDLVVQVSA